MEIYIDKGGVLQGTEEAADYEPKIKSRFEGHHMDCYQSLLNIGELDYTKGPTTEQIILRGGRDNLRRRSPAGRKYYGNRENPSSRIYGPPRGRTEGI